MSYLTSEMNPHSQRAIEKRIDKENAGFVCVCCIPLCIIGITHCLWTICVKAPYNGIRGLKTRYMERKFLKQEQKLKKEQELKRVQILNSLENAVSEHL